MTQSHFTAKYQNSKDCGQRAKHMQKDGVFLLIPNPHHGEDVSVDLIRKVLKRAEISRDQWFEAA